MLFKLLMYRRNFSSASVKALNFAPLIICVFAINLLCFTHNVFADESIEQSVEEGVGDAFEEVLSQRELWLDRTHGYISSYADNPAIWFDDFFINDVDQTVGSEAPSMVWRLINTNEYSDQAEEDLDVRLRARIDLPKLEKWIDIKLGQHVSQKLQLIINEDTLENNEGESLNSNLLSRDSDLLLDDNKRGLSSAIRWLASKDTSNIRVDLGMRSKYIFLKQIMQWRYNLGKGWQQELEQLLRWRSNDGLDAHLSSNFNKRITERWAIRQSNKLFSQEPFNQAYMQHGITFFHKLSDRTALSYNIASTWGFGKDFDNQSYESDSLSSNWQSHAINVRLRRRLYSNWLFAELEPFVNWQRAFDFDTNSGVILRFEFLFSTDL